MPTKANIGLLIQNSYAGSMPEPQEFVAFFQAAEELGFHSLWVTERFIHQVKTLHSFTTLAWAAGVTSRIKLGTAVVLATFRHPLLLAKTVANLDYLSGGRVILGLSLGGRPNEFEALGIPLRQRPRRFEETVAILRQLWSQPSVTFQGRHFTLEGVTMAPRPGPERSIPILLGGSAEPVLRRAAALADGWMAGTSGTIEQLRQRIESVLQLAGEAGKGPESFDISKLLYMAIDDSTEKARERLAASMHAYYGPQYDVDNNCAFGPPEACARGIQVYLDAGVKTLMLGLTWPDVQELERLKREVVPLLE